MLVKHQTSDAQSIRMPELVYILPNENRIPENPENTQRYHSYHGGNLKIGYKEVALNVIWYKNVGTGADVLYYRLSRTDMSPVVQSNKYLVPVEVHMHRILGRSNPVTKLRMSARQGGEANASYQSSFEAWHDKEFGLKWRMDKELRDKVLSLCIV